MGLTETKLQKELEPHDPLTYGERYFGLQNFGNTCYANSVLQVLFYCKPFRQYLLSHAKNIPQLHHTKSNTQRGFNWEDEPGILIALCHLFQQMGAIEGSTTVNKKKGSAIAPKQFIQKLRREAVLFNTLMHQDAQEFWSYLINSCVETLQKEQLQLQEQQRYHELSTASSSMSSDVDSASHVIEKLVESSSSNDSSVMGVSQSSSYNALNSLVSQSTTNMNNNKTFFHALFEGEITTDTRCITCETSSERKEQFLELSLDVTQNTSLSHCLHRFSSPEFLKGNDKFFCDNCCSLQEAQKRSTVTKWPQILCLHLKRFKYDERIGQHRKLPYRIAYPMQLRTPTDQLMSLFGVIIHVGSGPNSGHYKAVVKSGDKWVMFDDDIVTRTDESFVRSLYGCPGEHVGINETGYMLFYAMDEIQARDDETNR